MLHPGEFALGHTAETVGCPDDIVGVVNGKSSLGRLGLQVHATAGFIDPGFKGTVVLELSNVSNLPILLRPGTYNESVTINTACTLRASNGTVTIVGQP